MGACHCKACADKSNSDALESTEINTPEEDTSSKPVLSGFSLECDESRQSSPGAAKIITNLCKEQTATCQGYLIPSPGFGTYLAEPGEKTSSVVRDAIVAGCRHIDCAQVYGNEKYVGEGLRQGMEDAGISRSDLYITSKCWNTHRKKEHVRIAIDTSLADLCVEYLDLYLINWPQSYQYLAKAAAKDGENCKAVVINGATHAAEFFPIVDGKHPGGGDGKAGTPENPCIYPPNGVDFAETWKVLEEYVSCGKLKSIGVSNFTPQHMETLKKTAQLPISVNQVEHHPYLQQSALKEYCRNNNIVLVGYSTLLNPSVQKDMARELWSDTTLKRTARKYGKSVPQVLIRWALQEGVVPLTKSVNKHHIQENLNVKDFSLDDDDMAAIRKLDRGFRYNKTPSDGVDPAFGDTLL